MQRRRLLIIKHGFSETCDHRISPVVSLGDVFRCTCLLENFRGWHVSWITARGAKDLLVKNHLIDRLILADSPKDLSPNVIRDQFDWIINLEKQQDWCEFAAGIAAEKRFGFKDGISTGEDSFYAASVEALSPALNGESISKEPLQETLYRTIGQEWQGERYVLGYRPKVAEIYDIGLNHHAGPKWPTKFWPRTYWKDLHDRLTNQHYAVCWQQSLNSIRHYIEWLSSCRTIVTNDSLGLHLALALGKKVIGMFGSTAAEQVYMYGQGVKLTPTCDRNCIPCFGSRCIFPDGCMEYISVDRVMESVEMLTGAAQIAPSTSPARRRTERQLAEVNA